MEAMNAWVRPLAKVDLADVALVGGKAARLGQLTHAGYRVPQGLVITTRAYEEFVHESQLQEVIRMELGRKDLARMRWEELWDAALRIRTAFGRAPMPKGLEQALLATPLPAGPLAVRSSAPAEDGAGRSFAGLHASVLDRQGWDQVLAALRQVWTSLWSDMALLYRRELDLDPLASRMAVVVQQQVQGEVSGVAFGLDPRAPQADRVLVEAVPGRCAGLVDGSVDPDHYVLQRSTGKLLEHRIGSERARAGGSDTLLTPPLTPLLTASDLTRLHGLVGEVSASCGWPADIEWTLGEAQLTLLQARPAGAEVTEPPDDDRAKYRDYCPDPQQLQSLRKEVAERLIPALEADGQRLAAIDIESLEDGQLSAALAEGAKTLDHWLKVYEASFIPFAHGVRALGLYYNDVIQPQDPHEFLGLLKGERFLATERNEVLEQLRVFFDEQRASGAGLPNCLVPDPDGWHRLLATLVSAGHQPLAERLRGILRGALDVVFEGERLIHRPDLVLAPLMVEVPVTRAGLDKADELAKRASLERHLLDNVGPGHVQEAEAMLAVGRLSWRLRDDDNLLLGRIESQLLRAVQEAARRLETEGLLQGRPPLVMDAPAVAKALLSRKPLLLSEAPTPSQHPSQVPGPDMAQARQLVGQPASPGLAQGLVRCIRQAKDLAAFRPGEVLVCDAIQPQMTHLVPLAAAVVERRGGMLIHGAIIARELGIPCVNGIQAAIDRLPEGALVTVDGDLGIVTIGTTELP